MNLAEEAVTQAVGALQHALPVVRWTFVRARQMPPAIVQAFSSHLWADGFSEVLVGSAYGGRPQGISRGQSHAMLDANGVWTTDETRAAWRANLVHVPSGVAWGGDHIPCLGCPQQDAYGHRTNPTRAVQLYIRQRSGPWAPAPSSSVAQMPRMSRFGFSR